MISFLKKTSFFLFSFFFLSIAFAQDVHLIDSLSVVLKNAKADTLRIKLLNDISWQYKLSDLKKSFQLADEAQKLSEKINYKEGIAKGYILHGVYNTIAGNYAAALESYEKCKVIREGLHDSTGIAAVFHDIGTVHMYQGNYDKALDYLLKSLRIEERFGDKQHIGEGYLNVGDVYSNMKKFDQALYYYFKYIELNKGYGKLDALADIQNNIGNVYAQKEQNDSALFYLNEGLKTARGNGNKDAIANCLSGLAKVYFNTKKFDQSMDYYKQALAIHEELGFKEAITNSLNNISNVYVEIENFKKGIEYADRSLQLSKEIGAKQSITNAYLLLAQAYSGLNDYKKAYDYFEDYNLYNDSLVNEKSSRQIAEMQTRFETEKKDHENKLLSESNKIKDLTIEKNKTERNILFASIFFILLLSYLLYSRYRLKQKELLQAEILKERELRSKAVIEAEEQERLRIAKDLHDGIGQTLSAAKMNMSNLESGINSFNEEQHMMMQNAIELIDESVKEVRSVSHNMMPNALLKTGLAKAVRDFINKLNTQTLRIDLQIVGLHERLDNTIETVLYRVIQENVSNIIRHSKASHVNLQLIRHDNEITVMIEDNGVGFDVNKVNEFDGIGLKNIQSRVAYLNGSVIFDSVPGKGTTTTIEIPLV